MAGTTWNAFLYGIHHQRDVPCGWGVCGDVVTRSAGSGHVSGTSLVSLPLSGTNILWGADISQR